MSIARTEGYHMNHQHIMAVCFQLVLQFLNPKWIWLFFFGLYELKPSLSWGSVEAFPACAQLVLYLQCLCWVKVNWLSTSVLRIKKNNEKIENQLCCILYKLCFNCLHHLAISFSVFEFCEQRLGDTDKEWQKTLSYMLMCSLLLSMTPEHQPPPANTNFMTVTWYVVKQKGKNSKCNNLNENKTNW